MSPSAPQTIHHEKLGSSGPSVFWAHGWGQSLESLKPLAAPLQSVATHMLIDLPGFGHSAQPEEDWDTAQYADAMAEFIKSQNNSPVIWIGHSFGCRVGIQLAARHPALISGLILIAGAGLKRKKNPLKKLYFKSRIMLYKFLKKLIPFGLPEQWLLKKFASRDYLGAGPMKNILVKTVNEDLSPQAAQIKCPVLLYYGSNDTETPPEFGARYAKIMPNAELIVLNGFDHYTILSEAGPQLLAKIKRFIQDHATSKGS